MPIQALIAANTKNNARYFTRFLSTYLMKKSAHDAHFAVELTEYGWSVQNGAERVGLFVTQRQAVSSAKAHLKQLRSQGIAGDLTVKGTETEGSRSRLQPFFKAR